MLRPYHAVLLTSLLVDGGTGAPSPGSPRADAGGSPGPAAPREADAGPTAPILEGIRWPEELHPLATLDGPAVLAAHAVLQKVLAQFPKEDAKHCVYSARSLEVAVSQEGGLYFVQVNRRLDKCGFAAPGFKLEFDWFELYAVSLDGKILARYPYHP